MRTDTIAVRDRIVAALDHLGGPSSTAQVAREAGYALAFVPHYDYHHDPKYRRRVVDCNGKYCLMQVSLTVSNRALRELNALEKSGVVQKIRIEGHPAAFWMLTNLPRFNEADTAALAALDLNTKWVTPDA